MLYEVFPLYFVPVHRSWMCARPGLKGFTKASHVASWTREFSAHARIFLCTQSLYLNNNFTTAMCNRRRRRRGGGTRRPAQARRMTRDRNNGNWDMPGTLRSSCAIHFPYLGNEFQVSTARTTTLNVYRGRQQLAQQQHAQ